MILLFASFVIPFNVAHIRSGRVFDDPALSACKALRESVNIAYFERSWVSSSLSHFMALFIIASSQANIDSSLLYFTLH